MDNQQLFQALSNMMELKLDPIKIEIGEARTEIDGIKDGISGMKAEIVGMKDEINGIKDEINGLKDEVIIINSHFDKLDSQVSALRNGQIETRNEIKVISIKVSETYEIAINAWGRSSENREWLKTL